MPWESAAIGLLTEAIKKLFGRLGDSLDERRAAELVSDATRQLLLANPEIEKVRANIVEAEALLKRPSAELLRVQVLLDRVLGNQESAHSAIHRMHDVYRMEGSKYGEAETYLLSGITNFEFDNFGEASESLRIAVGIFREIGHELPLANALEYTIAAAIHESQFDEAREALSELMQISRRLPYQIDAATILGRLGASAHAANTVNLALRFFVLSWVIQNNAEIWERIQTLSTNLGVTENQLQKIIEEMRTSYEQQRESAFAETVFREV